MDTEALLRAFLRQNPAAGAADLTLCLWQKHFGDAAGDSAEACGKDAAAPLKLTRRLIRVPADFAGLSENVMKRLAQCAAETADRDKAAYARELETLETFCQTGYPGVAGYLLAYRAAGCPKPAHTEGFLQQSAPCRIVPREVVLYRELFARVQAMLQKGAPVTVAIDGNSGSGKSTLAEVLHAAFGGNLIHMDDFFLQKAQRTPERYAEPGGNVDYERFSGEVAAGLASRETFTYRKFDCSRMALGETVTVQPKNLTIVEGSYSMHPKIPLRRDLSVFLGIDPVTQYRRILRRNGEGMAKRFLETWIPLENAYFKSCDVPRRCDFVYDNALHKEENDHAAL